MEYELLGLSRGDSNRILRTVLPQHGLATDVVEVSDRVIVDGVQGAGVVKLLRSRLHHWFRFDVVAANEGTDTTVIRMQTGYFAWYNALLAVVVAIACALSIVGLGSFVRSAAGTDEVTVGSSIAALACGVFVYLSMRLALNRPIDGVLEDIRSEVRKAGGTMEDVSPVTPSSRIKLAVVILVLLISSLLIGVFVVGEALSGMSFMESAFSSAIFGILLAALILLVCGVYLCIMAARRTGLAERLTPMLPAMNLMLTVVFVLSAQVPAHVWCAFGQKGWDTTFEVRRLLETGVDPIPTAKGEPVPRGEVLSVMRQVRIIQIVLLIMALAVCVIGACIQLKAFRDAILCLRITHRLRDEVSTERGKAAASGRDFLKRFRWTFLTMWAAYSVLLAAGVASVCYGAKAAIIDPSQSQAPSDALGLPQATALLGSFLLGFGPSDPVLSFLADLLWIVWAAIAVGVISLSLVGHVRNRRQTSSMLFKHKIARNNEERHELLAILERASTRLNRSRPTIAVIPSLRPHAAAHEFGWRGCRQFIELSQGALDLLDPEEREALLAHEMSHLVLGHCRRHNRLQWLGRLTLLGGTFVTALQDSFGNELMADRFAVTRLGIKPEVLKRCLRKMHVAAMVHAIKEPTEPVGLGVLAPVMPNTTDDVSVRSGRWSRFRESVAAWFTLYTSDTGVGYWHPSVLQRIAELETT